MFTGIIQAVGKLIAVEKHAHDARLKIDVGSLSMSNVKRGDSIAINGVCLTVIEFDVRCSAFDVSTETLDKTSLGYLNIGDELNLETALTLATPLGGHLVTGHVDGLGTVKQRIDTGRAVNFSIEVPPEIARYIATKGSVCVDGVSLTVNAISSQEFTITIIPHTLEQTIIRHYRTGTRVNIEVDLLARYTERLLLSAADKQDLAAGLT